GEAICFAYDNSGFYTISETRIAQPLAQLKFYKRLK
ncbi:MAG TPA: PE-PGRS family protein, partial [Cytophagales bacterium]|nr:PE-PGRS family protein [Cytophagales bacterium]